MKTLADIADDNGTFAIIAMDQRNTLRRMFDAVGANQVTWRRPVGCWWRPSHPTAGITTGNRALIASKNRTAAGFSIKAVMR